ncbi:MAG: radical SAM protein [candidate division Zixibacteria bacterium]|nr:radical SAM protein [candidate division Zixibacteria bacterium]
MQTLKLQEEIIYGPINSRRLGRSLGINLLPTAYKLCPFNCIYCQYGWTDAHTDDASEYMNDLPTTDELEKVLEGWLKNDQNIDYITFSGNGEPCVHPQFDQMVGVASKLRNKYVPQVRLAILSNSTCLKRSKVIEGLKHLDERIMKLDCGSEEIFQKVNRPHKNIEYEEVVESLKNLDDIIIQSLLVDGEITNIENEEIEKWIGRLNYIKPREVQIYSIDRPSADQNLELVGKDKLKKIAQKAEKVTGISVEVF